MNNRKTLTTALTVAFGGFIGATIALWMHHSFWGVTLGFVVGGFITYILCDFKAVIHAIPEAYRLAHGQRVKTRSLLQVTYLFVIVMNITLGFCSAIALLLANHSSMRMGLALLTTGTIAFFTSLAFCSLILVLDTIAGGGELWPEDPEEPRKAAINSFPLVILFWHVPRLAFRLVVMIGKVLWALAKALVAFIAFSGRFMGRFFLLIHSDDRLLGVANALVGVSVGCTTHNALIGGAVGGILWLVCKKIIAKRVLMPRGLIPARR